ncbi:MAG: MOSC domain-containing protein [Woeseiaceae bacterium]|nr:MOSC domain-containing protein [Woeseiaceae bacterium]
MRLTSINTGPIRAMQVGKQMVDSAIDKRPAAGAVSVTRDGLDGDEQADPRFHGGPDQAVYLYSVEDYAWWSEQLGRALSPGLFGENLTIEGLPGDLFIGDRLLIGRVVLEVTGPRQPCSKFAAVMEDEGFGQTFIAAERPGAYCRVLNEGHVEVGDTVSLVTGSDVAVLDVFRLSYDGNPASDDLERVLSVPLAERLREKFAGRLRKVIAAAD